MSLFDSYLPPTQTKKEEELTSALERQIDVVLRLEDERLALLRETKALKEQLNAQKENSIFDSTGSAMFEKVRDINKKCREFSTQTDDSTHEKSIEHENSQIYPCMTTPMHQEASIEHGGPEKKGEANTTKKRPIVGKMPVKSLKLMKGKENRNPSQILTEDKADVDKSFQLNISKIRKEDVQARELEALKDEMASLKMENRFYIENYKTLEKEKNELRRDLATRDDEFEHLQKEVSHLRMLVASNDYKTIHMLESELRKSKEMNKEQKEELIMMRNDKFRLEEELKALKSNVTKLKEEYEKENKKDLQIYGKLKESQKAEAKISHLEKELKKREEEICRHKEDTDKILAEKERLEEDVEYFKQLARTAKVHAEKAIADVDTYRNMLNETSKGKR